MSSYSPGDVTSARTLHAGWCGLPSFPQALQPSYTIYGCRDIHWRYLQDGEERPTPHLLQMNMFLMFYPVSVFDPCNKLAFTILHLGGTPRPLLFFHTLLIFKHIAITLFHVILFYNVMCVCVYHHYNFILQGLWM